MARTLEEIDVGVLEDLERFGGPFWDMPDIFEDPYFGLPSDPFEDKRMLFISGPSRNGNHLLHSILDGHPDICNLPGEDSFLAAFFQDLREEPRDAKEKLRSDENIEYILSLTSWGINKWKRLWELWKNGGFAEKQWAGIQPMGGGYVADYQDTVVPVDYPSYRDDLKRKAPEIRKARRFLDVFWLYLDAMRRLNPEWSEKPIGYAWVGSGMRAEIRFVFERDKRALCVAPIRPFETFYYSFAKGRMKTEEVRLDVLKEAWEHWCHKTVDYLMLKRTYPDRVCLLNFNHLVEETRAASEQLCRFLNVGMSETCLIPTCLGRQTKGNSSFPKDEQVRGVFYSTGLKRKLARKHWPEVYPALWEKVKRVAI